MEGFRVRAWHAGLPGNSRRGIDAWAGAGCRQCMGGFFGPQCAADLAAWLAGSPSKPDPIRACRRGARCWAVATPFSSPAAQGCSSWMHPTNARSGRSCMVPATPLWPRPSLRCTQRNAPRLQLPHCMLKRLQLPHNCQHHNMITVVGYITSLESLGCIFAQVPAPTGDV